MGNTWTSFWGRQERAQRDFGTLANLSANVGDMIEIDRGLFEIEDIPNLPHYSHWAICLGNYILDLKEPDAEWMMDESGELNLVWNDAQRIILREDPFGEMYVVHFRPNQKLNRACVFGAGCPGRVVLERLADVVNGHPCRVNNYVNGRRNVLQMKDITMHWIRREINYHLIDCNCEHFATFCRSGTAISQQSDAIHALTKQARKIWNGWLH